MKITEIVLAAIIGAFVFFGCMFVYLRESSIIDNQLKLQNQILKMNADNTSNLKEISKAFQRLNEIKQDKVIKK